MSIHENSTGNAQTPENAFGSIGLNDSSSKGKASVWPSSSIPEHKSAAEASDLPAGPTNATLPKVHDELQFYPLKLPDIFCFTPGVCNSNCLYITLPKSLLILCQLCAIFLSKTSCLLKVFFCFLFFCCFFIRELY